jgi:hypothetical protein
MSDPNEATTLACSRLQHCGEASLLTLLLEAVTRGVEVVYIVPSTPLEAIRAERRKADAFREAQARGDISKDAMVRKLPACVD